MDGPGGDAIAEAQLRTLIELGIHTDLFELLEAQVPRTHQELLDGDAEQTRLALHTIAGSMRMIGAGEACDRLVASEDRLRGGGSVDEVRAEADELIAAVSRSIDCARTMVSRLVAG